MYYYGSMVHLCHWCTRDGFYLEESVCPFIFYTFSYNSVDEILPLDILNLLSHVRSDEMIKF